MVPFVVNAYLAYQWSSFSSQAVILVTTVAYAAWFIFIYASATVLHPDPQSPIAFLFVGIYAAPALFLLWLIGAPIEGGVSWANSLPSLNGLGHAGLAFSSKWLYNVFCTALFVERVIECWNVC